MGRPGMVRNVGLAKYFWGIATSLITLLIGAWLMLAPFAIGFQPSGDWIKATQDDFWTGLVVAIVSLLSLLLFVFSLRRELRAAGLIPDQPKPVAPTAPSQAAQAPIAPSQAAQAPIAKLDEDELERTIAILVASLAADLAERRKADNGQTTARMAGRGKL
jgi:hypothetical protein